jgi:hypothetical protein
VAKRNKKSYSYPPQHEGDALEKFECITFFVPAGWWNRANLIGAYSAMGSYFMQLDTDYGRAIADAWRECYRLSRENEYMCKVTNNITVSCGCASCSGAGGDLSGLMINPAFSAFSSVPQDTETELSGSDYTQPSSSIEPLPADYQGSATNWQEYNEAKCLAINHWYSRLVKSFGWLADQLDNGLAFSLEGLLTAVAIALSDGPTLPFGDAAAIALLLVPATKRLINFFGVSTDDIRLVGDHIDGQAVVSALYNSNGANVLQSAVYDQIYANVFSATGSDRLADWSGWYATLALNDKVIDRIWNGVGSILIPLGYVPEFPCNSNIVPVNLSWPFTESLEGWAVVQSGGNGTTAWSDNFGGSVRAVATTAGGTQANAILEYTYGENVELPVVGQDVTSLNCSFGSQYFTFGGSNQQLLAMQIAFDDSSTWLYPQTAVDRDGTFSVPITGNDGKMVRSITVEFGWNNAQAHATGTRIYLKEVSLS